MVTGLIVVANLKGTSMLDHYVLQLKLIQYRLST